MKLIDQWTRPDGRRVQAHFFVVDDAAKKTGFIHLIAEGAEHGTQGRLLRRAHLTHPTEKIAKLVSDRWKKDDGA